MTGLAPRPRCSRDGCKAWRLNDAVRECVAHAQPDERRFALQRAHAERDLRLLERTDFGPDLMTDVTTTAPRDGAGAPVLHRLSLNGANVTAGASFAEMTLVRATFAGATFTRGADFRKATFKGGASFAEARFPKGANFNEAVVEGALNLSGVEAEQAILLKGLSANSLIASKSTSAELSLIQANIDAGAVFRGTTFNGSVKASEATFGDASFFGARFRDGLDLSVSVFNGPVNLESSIHDGDLQLTRTRFRETFSAPRCRFTGSVRGANTTCLKRMSWSDSEIEGDFSLSNLRVSGSLDLNRVAARARASLTLDALNLEAVGAQFTGIGSRVVVNRSSVNLSGAAFPAGLQLALGTVGPSDTRPIARLMSLRHADASGLRISGVDLSSCSFMGALGLDDMTIESSAKFARAPSRWRRLWRCLVVLTSLNGKLWVPTWPRRQGGRMRRQVLADEWAWRRRRKSNPEWWAPPDDAIPPTPAEISLLYRSLRKGREDTKDEPGAADFYYGEMEMRRLASPRWSFERLLLSAYRLLNGYGVRAARSLLALLAVITLGAVVLDQEGFRPTAAANAAYAPKVPPACLRTDTVKGVDVRLPCAEAWLTGASFALVLPTRDLQSLTNVGDATRIALRVSGPILIALTALALRSRVKR